MNATRLLGVAVAASSWRGALAHPGINSALPPLGGPLPGAVMPGVTPRSFLQGNGTSAAVGMPPVDTLGGADPRCLGNGTVTPCIVNLLAGSVANATIQDQSLLTGSIWRNCRMNSCGQFVSFDPDAPVTLTYTFDKINAAAAAYYAQTYNNESLLPLDADAQRVAQQVLADIPNTVNIKFRQVFGNSDANIFYAKTQTAQLNATEQAAGVEIGEGANATTVTLIAGGGNSYHLLAHETGHAMGLFSHPFDNQLTRVHLPQGPWLDDQRSTIMSYNYSDYEGENTWDSLRFGGVDWSALVFNYGLAQRLVGDTVHTLSANDMWGGRHDHDGYNTLRANSTNRVTLSLRTDFTPSCVDGSVTRLSPSSMFYRGDLDGTDGGVLLGNDLPNVLIGTPQPDIIATGSNDANITTGGGSDVVVVQAGAGTVRINDFNSQTQIAFDGNPAVTQLYVGNFTELRAGNTTVILPGNIHPSILANYTLPAPLSVCGSAPAPATSTLPAWVMPAVIGTSVAGGVAVFAMMVGCCCCCCGRKKAPDTDAAV